MDAPPAKPLDTAQAARFRQALGLLQSGRHDSALVIAEALAAQAPQAADAWQLLGMCLAANGRQQEADTAFERALALLPGNATVQRNYAVSLAGHGRSLLARGRPEDAEPVLRRAVSLSPDLAYAWADLGTVLRMLGRVDDALAAFHEARGLLDRRGADSSGVRDAISGTLADAGRPAEALAHARRLVAERPGFAPAHETLGHLLWEYGTELAPSEDPLETFRAAALAQPGNRDLQLAFVRMLLATKRGQEAFEHLQPLRRDTPGDPLLDWYVAEALDLLGEHARATQLFEAAARAGLAGLPAFLNARARHAFRTRQFDLAAACAGRAVEIDPTDQEGWCYLGTAWRLLGDGREYWLFDYERLVGFSAIEPPPGYRDLPAFLADLKATLEALHTARREPVSQSVRGGTQTAGLLFGRDAPVIRAAEAALRRAVEAWLATLPDDPTHPYLSRKGKGIRFSGSWSIRLLPGGHHSNHFHGKGWTSSAFYVSVPGSVLASDEATREGWLQFGQPLEELGLGLPPRRVVRPQPGHLALFPSYMWHGTVPFHEGEPRMTIAFDVQPA